MFGGDRCGAAPGIAHFEHAPFTTPQMTFGPVLGNSACFVYRPKDCSRTEVRGRYPRLQTRGNPCGHRNCPHMTSLADHIREDPVFLSLLKMLKRDACEFRAP